MTKSELHISNMNTNDYTRLSKSTSSPQNTYECLTDTTMLVFESCTTKHIRRLLMQVTCTQVSHCRSNLYPMYTKMSLQIGSSNLYLKTNYCTYSFRKRWSFNLAWTQQGLKSRVENHSRTKLQNHSFHEYIRSWRNRWVKRVFLISPFAFFGWRSHNM